MVTLQAFALTLSLTGAGQTVLLDFYSDNCPPCRQMMPVIAQFEAKGYPVQKINVDQQPHVAQQHRVDRWPTFVMLRDGREVGRVVGYQPASNILTLYQRAGVTPEAYAQQTQPNSRLEKSLPQMPKRAPASPLATDRMADARPASVEPQRPVHSRLTVQQRAMAASVRIKVSDGQGHSYGSGTVVDAQDGEALVLTCGHIFRDARQSNKVTVDLFDEQGRPTGSVPGQVIRYDLKRDVGLIAIRPDRDIEPMKVAGRNHRVARGDRVFSIGCDKGNPPTVRESRVSHLNKYLGPANIEVAGAPTDGRSGGGLFSSDGTIIGVCNAADPEDDEGLYAALETIHDELISAKLDFIFENNAAIAQTPKPRTPNADPVLPRGIALPTAKQGMDGDKEVIIIVRDRNQPQQQGDVVFIREPSTDLLDIISRQRRGEPVQELSTLQPVPTPSNNPVIRGQN